MAKKGPPKWRPVLPNSALLRIPDTLEQAPVPRNRPLAPRLRGLEECLLVGRYELDAGGLQLGLGLGRVGVPELALLHLRLARQLHDEILVGLRQLVPAHLREHEDLGDDEVAGQAVDLAARRLVVVLRE